MTLKRNIEKQQKSSSMCLKSQSFRKASEDFLKAKKLLNRCLLLIGVFSANIIFLTKFN